MLQHVKVRRRLCWNTKEKIKYLTFSYSDTTANRCILQGLIDGVNYLKKPCTVELISSCELGVKKAQKGRELMLICTSNYGILIKKECEYSFLSCMVKATF